MGESTALAVRLADDKELAQIFVDSGLFKDVADLNKAIVKIYAGREIGLQPIESMTGINIFSGKITISGNAMASKIKSSGKYNYRVTTATAQECSIDFFEGGEKIGTSTYTFEEAKRADLTKKDTWQKYPSDLLFNRAMSRGVKRYCPDVFGCNPVYVPEEMGVDVNEDGEPINITPTDSQIVPKQKSKSLKELEKEIPTPHPSYQDEIDESLSDIAAPRVTPCDPLPHAKAQMDEKSQHFNPETQDNPHEAEPVKTHRKPRNSPKTQASPGKATDAPTKAESPANATGYLFPASIIKDTPYATLEAISDKATIQGLGKEVKPIIESVVPGFYASDKVFVDLPEAVLIDMVQKLTGVRMEE